MLKKTGVFISLLFIQLSIVKAQEVVAPSPIKWYDLETAMEMYEKNPKPVLIDVYTDWCSWCKHMMKTTFTNEHIANYINTNYYPVRFNAEGFDTIQYKGSTYINQGQGRRPTHNLAKELLNNRLSYPSFVYIDRDGNESVIPGYLDVRKQEPLLYYFAENINKVSDYQTFEKMFWYTYPQAYSEQIGELSDAEKMDTTGVVQWYTLEEAFAAQARNPKKIYVEIYLPGNVSSNVMNGASYRNKTITDSLNKYYYPVRFNAMEKDSIVIGQNVLINRSKDHPFHDFTVQFAVTNNQIIFPTIVYFDKQGQPITRLQEFLTIQNMHVFNNFFGSDAYMNQKLENYRNSISFSIN